MPVERRPIVLSLLLSLALASQSAAAVLCVKKRGGVVVRDGSACKPRETPLDVASLGLKGERGEKGDKGDSGDKGEPGDPGPAGPFPTADLPSGATLRGAFQLAGTDTPAVAGTAATAITFVFPLAQAPEPHLVVEGGPPVAACPGTVDAPEALAGHVCIYTGSVANASSFALGDPVTGVGPGSSRFGVTLSAAGSFDSNYSVSGTWAVTAP
jgi:hypothetical protein